MKPIFELVEVQSAVASFVVQVKLEASLDVLVASYEEEEVV
ncbi:CLUMA_CG006901, isoform A, partial [Clunio marinus]